MKGMRYSLLAIVLTLGVVAVSSPAKADAFEDEVAKVETLSETISGIVSAMTTVAITPMGLGAAMKTFRHIVLNNV